MNGLRARRATSLIGLFFGILACTDEAAEPDATASPVATTGGVLLRPVPAVEQPDLWPLPAQWQLVVTRAPSVAGPFAPLQPDTESGDADSPRLSPPADEVSVFDVRLLDADGSLRARGLTAPVLITATDPDRDVFVYLAPAGATAGPVAVVDKAGKPVTFASGPGITAVVGDGGGVFVAGGAVAAAGAAVTDASCVAPGAPTGPFSAAVVRLDPATRTLNTIGTLTAPTAHHTATALGGGIVAFAGGYRVVGSTAQPTFAVDVLRVNQATIAPAPYALARARARHAAVAVDGRLVVAGGEGSGSGMVELWDPGSGTLAEVALAQARKDAVCALLFDPVQEQRQVWVIGGMVAAKGSAATVDRIEVFAVDGAKLIAKGTLAMPDGQRSLGGAIALAAPLGIGLVGGFRKAPDQALAEVWWHGLPGTAWTAGVALSGPRGCAATTVTGSRVVLVGGVDDKGALLNTAAIAEFDAAKPGLIAQRMLPAARAGGVAVTLPGGAVLVAGGVALPAANGRQGQTAGAAAGMLWMWP